MPKGLEIFSAWDKPKGFSVKSCPTKLINERTEKTNRISLAVE